MSDNLCILQLLTFTVTPTVKVVARKLRRGEFPVIGLAESWILVDLGDRFSLFQHLLETEEVAINALPIRSPSGVLKVARNCATEENCAVLILNLR